MRFHLIRRLRSLWTHGITSLPWQPLAAAAAAVEVGSSDGVYFYGENVCVVTDSAADLYIIQPDKTLKAVGTVVLGDDKSIEIVDGKVTLKGFNSATAGQQPRINAGWYCVGMVHA